MEATATATRQFIVSANKDQLQAKGLFNESWGRSHPRVPNRVYNDFANFRDAEKMYDRLNSMGLTAFKNWL